MFRKSLIALSALSMVAVPAVAEAHHRYGGYDGYASQGYYPQQQSAYSNGYYPQSAYNGDGYYGRSYGYRQHRCSGTTGTIVGAGAGALLGRAITRGGGYYRSGSGTTGTIVGAAVGALLGRSVGKSTC